MNYIVYKIVKVLPNGKRSSIASESPWARFYRPGLKATAKRDSLLIAFLEQDDGEIFMCNSDHLGKIELWKCISTEPERLRTLIDVRSLIREGEAYLKRFWIEKDFSKDFSIVYMAPTFYGTVGVKSLIPIKKVDENEHHKG